MKNFSFFPIFFYMDNRFKLFFEVKYNVDVNIRPEYEVFHFQCLHNVLESLQFGIYDRVREKLIINP